jgi:hypothetical protein
VNQAKGGRAAAKREHPSLTPLAQADGALTVTRHKRQSDMHSSVQQSEPTQRKELPA